MGRSGTKALVQALRTGVAATMTAGGWEVDRSVGGNREDIGAFRQAVNDEFFVSAAFYQYPTESGAEIVAHVSVALVYEPAERLSERLGLSKIGWVVSAAELTPNDAARVDGRSEAPDAGDYGRHRGDGEASGDGDGDGDTNVYENDDEDIILTTAADIPRVVGELTVPVLEQAVACAEPHATVEAFLRALDADAYADSWQSTRTLVLAGAGRLDEARAALVAGLAGLSDLDDLRFRQHGVATLTRWLADGSVPANTTGRSDFGPGEPATASLIKEWKRSRARSAASDAVRAKRAGKDRSELRAMLLAELDARNVDLSPRSVEGYLDGIEADTTAAKLRLGVTAVKQIAELGKEVRTIMQGRSGKDESVDPFRPPAVATYPSAAFDASRRPEGRWIAADLVDDPGRLLEPILDACSTPIQRTADVLAWLSWETDSDDGRRSLAVHIGAERVATLPDDQVVQYQADMDEAASLGLQPFTAGRLTGRDRPPLYLLEIAKP